MAHVVMADDSIAFHGAMAENRPLGGAETAFVALAEALSLRGHTVEVRNRCEAALTYKGVHWLPLARDMPRACDLYIGSRSHRVIGLVRDARRRLFWLHNPARYLRKARNVWRLAWWRPTLVVTGAYHAGTIPSWLLHGGCETIPYGVLDRFRTATPREPPPPCAVFTSNPLRGLDWLLDLWVTRIVPAVPEAELHIYAGPSVYGALGARRSNEMEAVLARADTLSGYGVRRFAPIGREALAAVLAGTRVMLYRGDPGETFCASAGEAQAMGIPGVVQDIGSLRERIEDGVTGFVADNDDAFAAAAIRLLTEDALWTTQHAAALARKRGFGWDHAAAEFEALLA
jgi:glycosyltransferase involved in cell wall biosynthesis